MIQQNEDDSITQATLYKQTDFSSPPPCLSSLEKNSSIFFFFAPKGVTRLISGRMWSKYNHLRGKQKKSLSAVFRVSVTLANQYSARSQSPPKK